MSEENELEFGVTFKQKRTPFKRCDECEKRKLSTVYYHVYDTGLNSYIKYWVCKLCMIEAKARARLERAEKDV